MGNRSIVTFKGDDMCNTGVYLHWNGGPESVCAFARVMLERGWTRSDYATARFAAVAIEFFDQVGDCSGHSVGIIEADSGAGDDNGVFEIDFASNLAVQKHKGKAVRWALDGSHFDEEKARYEGIVEKLRALRELRAKNRGKSP